MRISRKLLASIIVMLLGLTFLVSIQFIYFYNIDDALTYELKSQNLSQETYSVVQNLWLKQVNTLQFNSISLLITFLLLMSFTFFFYFKWYITPINKLSEWIKNDAINHDLKKIKISYSDEINGLIEAYNAIIHSFNSLEIKNKKNIESLKAELDNYNSQNLILKNKNTTLEEKEKMTVSELRKTRLELEYAIKKINHLQANNEKLKVSTHNKSEFLANMSHEIRTPLNAIVGLSQILCKDAEDYDISETFLKQLNTIKIAGTNLAELINNLLDLSKLEAGKATIHVQKTNFSQLFVAIHQINKTKAQEKEIKFDYDIDKKIPEYLYLERTKINQVLMNFVSNAIKFTPKGKAILMIAKMEGEKLLFEIRDEGIGIPKDAYERIFLAFEQSHDSITTDYGGTGLGLSIAKAIAERLDGKVWVESVESEGSSFFFEVPVSEKPPEGIVEDDEEVTFPQYAKDQEILVIEDDQDNLEMLTLLIQKLNLPMHTATNGEEGFNKMVEIMPSLIICDLKMPVMSGFTFIKKAKENQKTKHIPVIVISAVVNDKIIKKTYELGFDDYLVKPIQISNIIKYFNKYLNKDKGSFIQINDKLYQSLTELVKLNSFKYQEILEAVKNIDLNSDLDENIKNMILKLKKAAVNEDMMTIVHLFMHLEKTLLQYSK